MANLQKYIFKNIFFALGTKIECAEFEPRVFIKYGPKLANIHKNINLHINSQRNDRWTLTIYLILILRNDI